VNTAVNLLASSKDGYSVAERKLGSQEGLCFMELSAVTSDL
jgi:hypothetical protein